MTDKRYHLQLAWHGLFSQPRTTCLAICTMALGIAACMTALTILRVVGADPLPGRSRHLYLAWVDARPAPVQGSNDTPHDAVPSGWYLHDAKAFFGRPDMPPHVLLDPASVTTAVASERHRRANTGVLLVNASFFRVFGVPFVSGAPWRGDEARSAARVAVIDRRAAEKMFGTTQAQGRVIDVNGHAFRVVGVTGRWHPQPTFYAPSRAFSRTALHGVFLPIQTAIEAGVQPQSRHCDRRLDMSAGNAERLRECRLVDAWVRLDTPSAVAAMRQSLQGYASGQHAQGHFARAPTWRLYRLDTWLRLHHVVPDSARLNGWMGFGFLLLCMANVTGLLTAKFMRRSAETGIRRALGARRSQVFIPHVIEALMVSLCGGLLAWPLTEFGLWVARKQQLDYMALAHFDVGAYGWLLLMTLGIGLLTGVLPAIRASLAQPGLQVKRG